MQPSRAKLNSWHSLFYKYYTPRFSILFPSGAARKHQAKDIYDAADPFPQNEHSSLQPRIPVSSNNLAELPCLPHLFSPRSFHDNKCVQLIMQNLIKVAKHNRPSFLQSSTPSNLYVSTSQ